MAVIIFCGWSVIVDLVGGHVCVIWDADDFGRSCAAIVAIVPAVIVGIVAVVEADFFAVVVANNHVGTENEFSFNFWVNEWGDAKDLDFGCVGHVELGSADAWGAAREVSLIACLHGDICALEEIGVEIGAGAWDEAENFAQ